MLSVLSCQLMTCVSCVWRGCGEGMETLGWYRYEGTYDCEGIGRELERVVRLICV